MKLRCRPVADNNHDLEFLYIVYASTRLEELAPTGWSPSKIEEFLRMQFTLQHEQYRTNYSNASFEIISVEKTEVGRLYVDRRNNDIRIMDIALLPDFRKKGIGGKIFNDLIKEADSACLPLSLHVEMNNPILPYYTKLGFINKGEVGVYYFMERISPNSI